MGKNLDKLGTIDDFRAPWETEGGEDAEINKGTLRRLIFNLKKGEAQAKDDLVDAKTSLEAAETKAKEAEEKAAKVLPEDAQKELASLRDKNEKLSSENEKLKKDASVSELRNKVLEGVPANIAKYVTGETEEELEKALETLAKDLGHKDASALRGKPGSDDDGDDDAGRRSPRSLFSPGDPAPGADKDGNYDFDKVADQILVGGPFG